MPSYLSSFSKIPKTGLLEISEKNSSPNGSECFNLHFPASRQKMQLKLPTAAKMLNVGLVSSWGLKARNTSEFNRQEQLSQRQLKACCIGVAKLKRTSNFLLITCCRITYFREVNAFGRLFLPQRSGGGPKY